MTATGPCLEKDARGPCTSVLEAALRAMATAFGFGRYDRTDGVWRGRVVAGVKRGGTNPRLRSRNFGEGGEGGEGGRDGEGGIDSVGLEGSSSSSKSRDETDSISQSTVVSGSDSGDSACIAASRSAARRARFRSFRMASTSSHCLRMRIWARKYQKLVL